MSRAVPWVGWIFLAVALPARGEGPPRPPEALLAKECLGYLRLDGLAGHREGFDKTALAEVLRNDTGRFIAHLAELIQDQVGPGTVKDRLLSGLPPAQLMKIHAASSRLPQVANYLYENGLVVGFEYVSLLPPQAQLTIICPQGGQTGNREAIFAAFQLIAALNDLKVEETTQAGRAIVSAKIDGPVQWRWWQEADHVITTIGNAAPEHTISLVEGKRANLTASELYQSLASRVSYPAYLRGFVDAERSLRLVKLLGKDAEKAVDELGLFGLKSLTFHMGYAGRQTRTSLVINTAAERKGLLKLFNAPADFALEPLPPLPPDAASVAAIHLDLGQAYDVIREAVMKATSEQDKDARELFTKLDQALGLNLRNDLLAALGSKIVVYNSAGEGFLGSGIGLAIQVKDERKLKDAAAIVMASLPSALEANLRLASREVAGATVHSVHLEERRGIGLATAPSYAIHDGWLVLGLFPQTVNGYLYRKTGKFETWKPSPLLNEALAEVKKNSQARILALSESSPKWTLRDLASIGPFFFAQIGAFSDTKIDPALVPQYQVMTEPLFPNIGLIVDDGQSVRFETFSSLGIPFDPLGLHPYWFGAVIVGSF
jgi:hypothetical protein